MTQDIILETAGRHDTGAPGWKAAIRDATLIMPWFKRGRCDGESYYLDRDLAAGIMEKCSDLLERSGGLATHVHCLPYTPWRDGVVTPRLLQDTAGIMEEAIQAMDPDSGEVKVTFVETPRNPEPKI